MRLGQLAFSLFALANKSFHIHAYGSRSNLPSAFSKIPTTLHQYNTRKYFSEISHDTNTNLLFLGADAMTRRRLYTEHKYVTYTLSEFSRYVAKTDFSSNDQIAEVSSLY